MLLEDEEGTNQSPSVNSSDNEEDVETMDDDAGGPVTFTLSKSKKIERVQMTVIPASDDVQAEEETNADADILGDNEKEKTPVVEEVLRIRIPARSRSASKEREDVQNSDGNSVILASKTSKAVANMKSKRKSDIQSVSNEEEKIEKRYVVQFEV